MEHFLSQIEWIPTLTAFFLAFGLGSLWYSPILFLKPWLAGLPEPPKWRAPMWIPMSAQAGSTLLLAILLNLAIGSGHLIQAVLMVFTVAGFIKASGFYCGKTMTAVSVEVGYIVTMSALIIGTYFLF